jgi:hypothetical protein
MRWATTRAVTRKWKGRARKPVFSAASPQALPPPRVVAQETGGVRGIQTDTVEHRSDTRVTI